MSTETNYTPGEAGDIVHWFHGGDTNQEPLVGLVTRASSSGQLDLRIYHPESTMGDIRNAVHHVSAKVAEADRDVDGGWDHTPRTKRRQDAVATINALVAAVKGLVRTESQLMTKISGLEKAVRGVEMKAEQTDARVGDPIDESTDEHDHRPSGSGECYPEKEREALVKRALGSDDKPSDEPDEDDFVPDNDEEDG